MSKAGRRSRRAPRWLFVTGTDTGVGKTVLTVWLVRHLHAAGRRAAAFKPICSGGRGDARELWRAQGGAWTLDEVNPWHFGAPVAPLLASRREGQVVRLSAVVRHLRRVAAAVEFGVVEGAGGVLSPLGEGFDSRDLVVALRADPVIVGMNRLGAVSQVRLALRALPPGARRRAWVILMEPARPDRATAGNLALLRECEPGVKARVLPWILRWREPLVRMDGAVRRVLEEVVGPARPRGGAAG
jgi:dethiobiotin synthetase